MFQKRILPSLISPPDCRASLAVRLFSSATATHGLHLWLPWLSTAPVIAGGGVVTTKVIPRSYSTLYDSVLNQVPKPLVSCANPVFTPRTSINNQSLFGEIASQSIAKNPVLPSPNKPWIPYRDPFVDRYFLGHLNFCLTSIDKEQNSLRINAEYILRVNET